MRSAHGKTVLLLKRRRPASETPFNPVKFTPLCRYITFFTVKTIHISHIGIRPQFTANPLKPPKSGISHETFFFLLLCASA